MLIVVFFFKQNTAYEMRISDWSSDVCSSDLQGIMFGYASNETENLMPLALDLAHRLLYELAALRREDKEITYLRPDSKAQVTLEYDDNHKPVRIDAIVVSTQHDDFDNEAAMLAKIKSDIIQILVPRVKAQLKHDLQQLFTDRSEEHTTELTSIMHNS